MGQIKVEKNVGGIEGLCVIGGDGSFQGAMRLCELGIPCIVALNMLDIAEKQQIRIDIDALSARLGCPVVPLVSTQIGRAHV